MSEPAAIERGTRRMRRRNRKNVADIVRKEYPDMMPEDVSDLVSDLTDPGRIVNRFLEPILEPGRSAVREVVQGAQQVRACLTSATELRVTLLLYDLTSPLARNKLTRRVLARLGGVAGSSRYGPVHSAVAIDGVVVSWDNSSLVVPEPQEDDTKKGAKFAAGISQHGLLRRRQVIEEELRVPLPHKDEEEEEEEEAGVHQMELVSSVACSRSMLVYELAELIARYNREKRYRVLSLNCHHFVRDVLRILGVKQEPAFAHPALHRDFQRLKRGMSVCGRTHRSHTDLDRYIDANLHLLTHGEMEALRNVYAKYHRRARGNRGVAEWACPVTGCRLDCILRRMRELSSSQPLSESKFYL